MIDPVFISKDIVYQWNVVPLFANDEPATSKIPVLLNGFCDGGHQSLFCLFLVEMSQKNQSLLFLSVSRLTKILGPASVENPYSQPAGHTPGCLPHAQMCVFRQKLSDRQEMH